MKKYIYQFEKDDADRFAKTRAYLAKVRKMTPAKKRAWLIEIGALTSEGNVPVYPMDHVPLGPRE